MKKYVSAIALIFILPIIMLIVGCEQREPQTIGIEVELKENAGYVMDNNKINIPFNNLEVDLDESDFIVTKLLNNNKKETLNSSGENGYSFASSIPNNSVTPAGNYTITFKYGNFEELINVTVNKAEIDFDNAVWSNNSYEYDGKTHKPTISNLPNFATAIYKYKMGNTFVNEPIEVGNYTAIATLTTDNNHILVGETELEFNFKITEKVIVKQNFNFENLNLSFNKENISSVSKNEISELLLNSGNSSEQVEALIKDINLFYSGELIYSGEDFNLEFDIKNSFSGELTNTFNTLNNSVNNTTLEKSKIEVFTINLTNDELYNDFNIKVLLYYSVRNNIFDSIKLNNENIDYINFVNMLNCPIYSTIQFDVKPGYKLYAKVKEEYTPIVAFDFISKNQAVEFYYSSNDDESNKHYITTLTTQGDYLSFKINNKDIIVDELNKSLIYELSPDENSITLQLNEEYLNEFNLCVNNATPCVITNVQTELLDVKSLNNLKIYYNNNVVIELTFKQFTAIEKILLKTIDIITTEQKDNVELVNNTFTGFNEFITNINVVLKQEYSNFTSKLLLNENSNSEFDYTNLSVNKVYVVIFNGTNSIVETKEIAINYTFGDENRNVTNSSDEASFISNEETFTFVIPQDENVNPLVEIWLDEYQDSIFCFDYENNPVSVELRIIYRDESGTEIIEYQFIKNITIEFVI